MAGEGGRRAWTRRVAVLILAGLVLVVVLAVRWRLDADPNRAFLTADAAFKAGRHAEAAAALNRLERLRRPTSVDRLLRAEVAQARKDVDRAIAELAAIPDDDVVAPLARLRAGQIEFRRGLTRPAEAALRASLKLFPRGVQPRKELVYLYNLQHRQAELDAMLAELMDLEALDFAYVLHWTKTRNTVWNPSGDLPTLEKLVAADAGDRWSRLALAEALRRVDRPDEAGHVLSPLPESDPDARVERVLLAMGRGDFAASESLLAGGQADHPGMARLRGQLALTRRDCEAAAQQFRIALAADPADRLALHGLATALGMLGQAEAARPFQEAARRHDALWALVSHAATTEGENDPRLPHQLGMACAAIGRNLEARAWLRLAVRRDAGDAEGQRMLYRLEHGPRPTSAGAAARVVSGRGTVAGGP
jgi:tetratricopeptide (TPR) repeat protein